MTTLENRPPPGGRMDPEAAWAVAALAGVLLVTAGWWALALWPLPAETPEWVLRARAACFGSTVSGLPNAGGWALLVGQPLGMMIFLFAVWGASVTRGLEALRRGPAGRLALAASTVLLLTGTLAAATRVAGARGERFDPRGSEAAPLMEAKGAAPEFGLLDQHGRRISIGQFLGRPVLVTFAFAHCETVCPLLVKDLLQARAALGGDLPGVVVTLDPWRDTPARLPAIAAAWGLPEGVHLLSGTVAEVEFVLDRWKVPRIRNQSNGEVIHPAITYVVAPNGQLAYMADGSVERVVQAAERVRR